MMRYQSEILRFKEGARSQHPSPEATLASAKPGVLTGVGLTGQDDQIAVLVDLIPQLPYRSREIRTLVVQAYWDSSGSIVARMRRALAAANRHLVQFNRQAVAGNKCAGSITCAVFSGEELFLGQVGAAYAFIYHPEDTGFELFPRRNRLLVPLGGAVPPVINIGYTILAPGSRVCLVTTGIAEARARETWQQLLATPKLNLIAQTLTEDLADSRVSGSLILAETQKAPRSRPVPAPKARRPKRRWGLRPAKPHREPPPPAQQPATKVPRAPKETAPQVRAPQMRAPQVEPPQTPRQQTTARPSGSTTSRDGRKTPPPAGPPALAGQPAPPAAHTQSRRIVPAGPVGQPPPAGATEPRRRPQPAPSTPTAEPDAPSSPRVTLPKISLPEINLAPARTWLAEVWQRRQLRRQQRRLIRQERTTERSTTAERARLRQALRTLLPGKVEGQRPRGRRLPPGERAPATALASIGLVAILVLITMTQYTRMGGPLKAEELLVEARVAKERAFTTQDHDDWYHLLDVSSQIIRLDPQNTEAQILKEEAEMAIDALESAAMLNVMPLQNLGVAPKPRRILVADGWIYILNTATQSVVGLPLSENYVAPMSESPTLTTILQRGQSLMGETVGNLVDFAWVTPGGNYPDGAVFIYGEQGVVYIYEPTLGPASITLQRIQGDLQPGTVTAMETFGEKFYLVHRQLNQVLMYEPVNGIYDNPRPYFAEGMAPDLQLTLDVAIDGRIYLLMGNGEIQAYFAGSPDHSFQVNGLPDPDFQPLVMAVEYDLDAGRVYLGDTQRERIIVLSKSGDFMHQFRLPRGEMSQIEALAIHEDPHVLYLIAENNLYAAPLPTFVAGE